MLDQQITVHDEYKIFDKLEKQMRSGTGPVGWVRIFLQTKYGLVYDEGQNLVVAQGREFVAQKIFGTISGTPNPDRRNYLVSHFAVGSGGSTIEGGGLVTLTGPFVCDTYLTTPIELKSTYLVEPGTSSLPPANRIHAVKPIIEDGGSILLEPQTFAGGGGGSGCTAYTRVKCTCVVPSGQPESLGAGESVKIDEAGLYLVLSTDAQMFAHICFAPKWKEKESTLTIEWYILC